MTLTRRRLTNLAAPAQSLSLGHWFSPCWSFESPDPFAPMLSGASVGSRPRLNASW